MNDNSSVFWDKKISKNEVKNILADELNPRFIEFAASFLSRNNEPSSVFNNYLNKKLFIRNWAKIKRRMRENKWSDTRIIFWDEIYKAVRKSMGIKALREHKERPLDIDPDIKIICEQIKEKRRQDGLTQTDLAEKTGLSQQTISFVEKGYVNISLRTLKKIADALNLKVVLADR